MQKYTFPVLISSSGILRPLLSLAVYFCLCLFLGACAAQKPGLELPGPLQRSGTELAASVPEKTFSEKGVAEEIRFHPTPSLTIREGRDIA